MKRLQHRAAHASPRSARWFSRSTGAATADEAQLALFELRVTRIADLVLKVNGLLEQTVAASDAAGAERRARLAWVVEHGRAALQDAAARSGDGRSSG